MVNHKYVIALDILSTIYDGKWIKEVGEYILMAMPNV